MPEYSTVLDLMYFVRAKWFAAVSLLTMNRCKYSMLDHQIFFFFFLNSKNEYNFHPNQKQDEIMKIWHYWCCFLFFSLCDTVNLESNCVFQNTHTHFSALIQLLPVDVRHNFEQDIDLVVKHTEPLEMNTGCGSELRMNTLTHEQRKWMTKLC